MFPQVDLASSVFPFCCSQVLETQREELSIQEFLKAHSAPFLADAALLLASEGNMGCAWQRVVDPYDTVFQPLRHAHGPRQIAGVEEGRKPIRQFVRPCQNLLLC